MNVKVSGLYEQEKPIMTGNLIISKYYWKLPESMLEYRKDKKR